MSHGARPGGGAQRHHGRRARPPRKALGAADGVPEARRGAMRNLHAGNADGGRRSAGAQSGSSRIGSQGCARRRAVPLHRVSEGCRGGARCRERAAPAASAGSGAGCRRARRQGRWHRQAHRLGELRRRRDSAGRVVDARHSLASPPLPFPLRRPARIYRQDRWCRSNPDGARRAFERIRHLSRDQGSAGARQKRGAVSRRGGCGSDRHARSGRGARPGTFSRQVGAASTYHGARRGDGAARALGTG